MAQITTEKVGRGGKSAMNDCENSSKGDEDGNFGEDDHGTTSAAQTHAIQSSTISSCENQREAICSVTTIRRNAFWEA